MVDECTKFSFNTVQIIVVRCGLIQFWQNFTVHICHIIYISICIYTYIILAYFLNNQKYYDYYGMISLGFLILTSRLAAEKNKFAISYFHSCG